MIPVWSTACPDWAERLKKGLSIIPDPIYPDEAAHALAIFKQLRIVDAPGSPTFGESCAPWVFDLVAALFGSYDAQTGVRHIKEVFILIPKKNSKSTLAAGIMMTALLLNWRQAAGYTILAPTVEVAANAFNPARDMVRRDDDLDDLCQVQTHIRTITHRVTDTTLKVVAADPNTVSGIKSVGTLIDELWLFGKQCKAEDMLREAIGGLASRPEGFVVYTTTQSNEPPAGVFRQKLQYARDVRDGKIHDPHFLPVIFEHPPEMVESGAHLLMENLAMVNPNLGYSVDEAFLYGQGERLRERMRELQQIRDSFRQKDADLQSQYQTGDISEDFYRQALAQNAQYLSERLKEQEAFYAESDVQRADWQKGLQEGFSNWVDNASDYASQAAQLATEGISGMVNNITEMLNGNKVEWRSWASSVLQEISKVLMNAAIVNGIKTAANSMSGAGGFIGSIGSWLGGAVANAKGGVYTSANLSAYSNSIVDTPTYFAFAKGAGLMGEAGPEAIMPLTRAADGSLGVRAVGSMNGSAGLVYSPVYHIAIQNDGTNGQIGPEAAGSLVQLIDQRVQAVMLSMRRDGGMLSG
ncbi:TPA: phage tail tape measure protein [Escherichia coli]|nr:phage tail tape measure protein [Escherichia coli]